MEKIAIISDIHGNITALDTVLENIRKRGIKRIFCLGDMIIKCSSPYECAKKLFDVCEVIVKGNCELRGALEPLIDEHYWNKNQLTDEMIEKIRNLPISHDFYMSGYKIRMMHASPYSVKEKSTYWDLRGDFVERFMSMFNNTEYLGNVGTEEPDIVVFGHVHRNLVFRNKGKTLINPGAVSNTSELININGKEYTYGSYLILEGEYGSKELSDISYKIVKFTYDNIAEAEKILKTDMPNKENAYTEIMEGKYFSRIHLNREAIKKWEK